MTPGGGIDPGETEASAAVREVAEETGYVLGEEELIGPVATAIRGARLLRPGDGAGGGVLPGPGGAFEVDISAHTEEEQLTLQRHRWWGRRGAGETDAWVWPAELVTLWDMIDPRASPLDLGQQEESTVPAEVAPAFGPPGRSSAQWSKRHREDPWPSIWW